MRKKVYGMRIKTIIYLCIMGLLKKIVFGIYYVLKAAVFKLIEYLLRALIAILRLGFNFWGAFCVILLFVEVFIPQPTFKFALLCHILIFGWLFIYNFIRNFYDEDDRDYVCMVLARVEHRLCFANPQLSVYPDDWHWLEEA